FSVPVGTVTFTNKVKAAAAGAPFAEAAAKLSTTEVVGPLTEQAARNPGLLDPKTVYLTGGICWAVATYTHPELADRGLVPVTAADIDRFIARMAKADGLPDVDLAGVADKKVKALAAADAKRIRESFTTENLIAGATVLKGTM